MTDFASLESIVAHVSDYAAPVRSLTAVDGRRAAALATKLADREGRASVTHDDIREAIRLIELVNTPINR